jgi:hypothetical protein
LESSARLVGTNTSTAIMVAAAAATRARLRVSALTTTSTTMFAIMATMPTFRSVITGGQSGNALASVMLERDVHAIVATPVPMPAITPAGVASGFSGRLRSSEGKSWVTKL